MQKSTENLVEAGKQAFQKGNFSEAAGYFLEAEKEFNQQKDSLMAAEMANNRSVALLQAGDPDGAYTASRDTHLIFHKAGDFNREGLSLGNQAAALRELGRKKESLNLYNLSAKKLLDANDKENLAIVQKCISALELENGRHIHAVSAMLDALKLKEKLTFREKFLRKLFAIAARFMPK
jgi:tetratricopeptide (TPR) repeat protein